MAELHGVARNGRAGHRDRQASRDPGPRVVKPSVFYFSLDKRVERSARLTRERPRKPRFPRGTWGRVTYRPALRSSQLESRRAKRNASGDPFTDEPVLTALSAAGRRAGRASSEARPGRNPTAERRGRKASALAGFFAHRIRVPDAAEKDDPRVGFRSADRDGEALPICGEARKRSAFHG